MDKLVSVIGKAPSEMSPEELSALVERESRRMHRVLSASPKTKKATKKAAKPRGRKTVSLDKLREISRLTGVPLEDLRK